LRKGVTISFWRLAAAAAFLSLAACGSEPENTAPDKDVVATLSAATLGEQTVLAASDYLAREPFVSANLKNGGRQAQICKACHSLSDGGPNMIGPALFGFFGRGVGEQAGFDYSPAVQEAEFIWTPRALDAWLAQPGRFLPGNRMTFGGVLKQTDRDDLIAYLLVETSESDNE